MEAKRDTEAWAIVEAPPPTATLSVFPSEVMWTLLRARVAERLGRGTEAAQTYGWVAGIGRHADPELQPYVAEARAALARLTGER